MRITAADSIQSREKELLLNIIDDLDWQAIERALARKLPLGLRHAITSKRGDIVVYADRVAYAFNFDVNLNLRLIFDRTGRLLEFKTAQASEAPPPLDVGDDSRSPAAEKKAAAAEDPLLRTAPEQVPQDPKIWTDDPFATVDRDREDAEIPSAGTRSLEDALRNDPDIFEEPPHFPADDLETNRRRKMSRTVSELSSLIESINGK